MNKMNVTESVTALTSALEFLLSLEKKRVNLWEKELELSPHGSLYLAARSGKTFFQHAIDGRRLGLTRDIDLAYKLARKRYLQVMLHERKENLRRIHRATASSAKEAGAARKKKTSQVEELLHRYGEAGLSILRITCSEEQYRWVTANYRRNPLNPEQLTRETYSGIKVRSKSEQSIGNALEARGIPYRYEMAINLDVSWMQGLFGLINGRFKNYYPDFVILTSTGKYIIWEHLGLVDKEDYRSHNMEKISAYRQGGICDNDHLILTFEKDLEKPEILDQIIACRVMPLM